MSDIPMRDYLDQRMNDFERWLNERQKAVGVLFESQQTALEIARKELERRLDILNHAHEQSQMQKAEFVSRDTYEAEREKVRMDIIFTRDTVTAKIDEVKKTVSWLYAWGAGIGATLIVVDLVARYMFAR